MCNPSLPYSQIMASRFDGSFVTMKAGGKILLAFIRISH
jgi:hypothetical protein